MKIAIKSSAISAATAAMIAAAPVSASIAENQMNDGDITAINAEGVTVTHHSAGISDNTNSSPKGEGLKPSQDKANPSFTFTLLNMTEKRNTLWSPWNDRVAADEYARPIREFRVVNVPAPGILGLFGLALVALGFGRRRKRIKATIAAD